MFSIFTLKSSAEAGKYYQADNYYLDGAEDHLGLSMWYGKAAEELGFKGEIKQEDFQKLLEGKLPNGVILGKKEIDGIKHAPGIDGTFSAPKSVSIMAEVRKDRRLVEAHNKAVETVLKHVEESYARSRVKADGTMSYEKTGNLAIARFTHNISRAMDPQLHTHCVILNMTKREDGKWRSTEFHNIFEDKLLLGQMYRADLSVRVQELGYEVRATGKLNQFELSCVSEEAIEKFSKRSRDIKDFLGDNAETASAETKAKATILTRDSKKKANQIDLNKEWDKQLSADLIFQDKIHLVSQLKKIFFKEKEAILEYAFIKSFERSSIARYEDIFSAALEKTTGSYGMEAIHKDLSKKIANKELLAVKGYDEKEYYTTREALILEKQTIKLMRVGQNTMGAILDRKDALQQLSDSSLNIQQKEAALAVLTNKDRIIGIQGYAGVGKTFLFSEVKKVLDHNNVNVIGLSPSAKAAGLLEAETAIKSQTLQRLLGKYDGVINNRATKQGLKDMRNELKNTYIILDESSFASSQMFHDLLKLSHDLNFRVIAVGDIKQLDAVEAGKPFAQAQKAGMYTAKISNVIRQSNDQLKEAVYDSIQGDIAKAVNKIEKVIESGDKETLESKAVHQYISLSQDDRNKTLVVSSLNTLREKINEQIHSELLKEGALKGESKDFDIYDRLDHFSVEKKNAFNYKVGNVVIFNKKYFIFGIEADEPLIVKSRTDKQVTLLKGNREINFIPEKLSIERAKCLAIYEVKKHAYNEGEKIKFTNNSKIHPWVKNNVEAEIHKIEPTSVSFKLKDGTLKELKKDAGILRFLNYAYCQTVHSAQGSTVDKVIGVIPAVSKATTQKLFYVAISRAKSSAIVITDDKDKLIKNLSEKTGERISATDGRLEYLKVQDESHYIEPKNENKAINKGNIRSQPILQKGYGSKEIYNALYSNLPSALPEFGFVSRGSYMISTTTAKVDGGSGTKGKVYVYANNPGTLVDFTRGSTSIWDYAQTRILGSSSSKKEIYDYLCNLSGLSNSSSFKVKTTQIQKHVEEVKKEKPDYELNEVVKKYTQNLMFSIKNNHVMDYLKKERGYIYDEIAKMGIGFLPSKKKLGNYLSELGYEKDRVDKVLGNLHFMGQTHKLLIPFESRDGKVIGFVARYVGKDAPPNDLGKYLYSKGLSKSEQLFNLNNVKGNEVLIVEGIFDCLSAKSKGMDNVVALGGTSFNTKQLDLLKHKGITKISICLDNDIAGKEGTNKMNDLIKASLPNTELKNIVIQGNVKDVDEVLQKFSVADFKNLPSININNESKQHSVLNKESLSIGLRQNTSRILDKEVEL